MLKIYLYPASIMHTFSWERNFFSTSESHEMGKYDEYRPIETYRKEFAILLEMLKEYLPYLKWVSWGSTRKRARILQCSGFVQSTSEKVVLELTSRSNPLKVEDIFYMHIGSII